MHTSTVALLAHAFPCTESPTLSSSTQSTTLVSLWLPNSATPHPQHGFSAERKGKFLPLPAATDYRQEVAVLSQLRHPHIISFLAASTVLPAVFIIEELAEGGSLHDRLHGRGPRRTKRPLPYQQVRGLWGHLT